MVRTPLVLALFGALLLVPTARADDEPAWVGRVPDFRSEWPPPLAIGSEAPAFSLKDARTGRPVSLAAARKGSRVTLLLFLDENCGTCRRRAEDLGRTLERSRAVEGAAVLAVFTRNLVKRGAKPALDFAELAAFPEKLPLLLDDEDDRAGVTLAYRVSVSPTAVILDADGKIAYFGLALAREGSDLVPDLVGKIAAGGALGGPAFRAPFG